MTAAHRRHDMTDGVWERLRLYLPGERAREAGQPMTTGGLSTPFAGFCARALPGAICPRTTETGRTPTAASAAAGPSIWVRRGVWAGLLEAVMDDPDFEWLMIDASYIKAHPHSAGARGGNQAIARTKGG